MMGELIFMSNTLPLDEEQEEDGGGGGRMNAFNGSWKFKFDSRDMTG